MVYIYRKLENMKSRAMSTMEIVKFLKDNGYSVSKSEGRNSGSSVVSSTKGFNVSKLKTLSKLGDEIVEQFSVKLTGIDSYDVKKTLKEKYIVGGDGWILYVAGKKIR
jgi:hypothetical protein